MTTTKQFGVNGNAAYRVEFHGYTAECGGDPDQIAAGAKWVVEASGHAPDGSLRVVTLDAPVSGTDSAPAPAAVEAVAAAATENLRAMVRRSRLIDDESAAKAAGFSLDAPLYEIGRLVNSTGVENARTFRAEFEAKPSAHDACLALADQIGQEQRRDRIVKVREVAMEPSGAVTVPAAGARVRVGVTVSAFDSFCVRGGWSGGRYLRGCWPELRAHNVNEWTRVVGERADRERNREIGAAREEDREPKEIDDLEVKFRVRNRDDGREIFAAVSPSYAACDADTIALAIAKAAPEGSRAEVTYDGERSRFNVLFHSTVEAGDYGCGEIFRAGVVVRSSDIGDGSIRVAAMVERNLCLNLIVLHRSEVKIAGLRHIGDEAALVERFREAFASAMESISHFTEVWGYAREDEAPIPEPEVPEEEPITARDLLAGIAWSQLQRELVPVRGRKQEAVKAVLKAYDEETVKGERLTRADVVNAWTRYAQSASDNDPWIEDEIQDAAGRILADRKPLAFERPGFEY